MATHSYWSLNITAVFDGVSQASMTELEMYDSVGGVNLCTGGTASSTSEALGYPPANAFNGVLIGTDYWQAINATLPQRLIYQFVSPVDLVSYQIWSSDFEDRPTDWTLDYSDDGISWTTAATVTGFVFSQELGTIGIAQFDLAGVFVSQLNLSCALATESTLTLSARLAEVTESSLALSTALANESTLALSYALANESTLALSNRFSDVTQSILTLSCALVTPTESTVALSNQLLAHDITESTLALSVLLECDYQSVVIDIHHPETPIYGAYS